MSNIYEIPAANAPAAEWGRLAVSIPGWKRPMPRCGACFGDLMESFSLLAGPADAPVRVPDPDHWAWWGWFIVLLGPERIAVSMWVDHITVGTDNLVMEPSAIGRACIAAASALGRWPGGKG